MSATVAQHSRGSVQEENGWSGEYLIVCEILLSLQLLRVAEEHGWKPTGGHYRSHVSVVRPVTMRGSPEVVPHTPTSRGKIENILPTPPAQPLIRTDDGISVSYAIKVPVTMSRDGDGRHIRFSHCPKLRFPSMQYAFDYFHVQEKLYNQRVNQDTWQQHSQAGQQSLGSQQNLQATQQDAQATLESQAIQQVQAAQPSIKAAQMNLPIDQRNHLRYLSLRAEQLAEYAAQQACLANALSTCGPAKPHKTPRKPNDGLSLVKIPTPPRSSGSESRYQHATEPSTQNLWKARDPIHPTSGSSPPKSPPQTLFAESTPHAREIQAQPRPILPAQRLQTWPYQSKGTEDDSFLQSSSLRQPADQSMMLNDSLDPSLIYADTVLLRNIASQVNLSVQPDIDKVNALPSSYADTVLPQTLIKKDRRVLGVPMSAGIDE